MSEQTAIQWTDSTWNIVTGCTRVGPGCARCYIERTPPFRMIGRRFEMVGNESTTGVTLHWDRLLKVPRGPKVFTPSLGDLFHDEVPDVFIASAFDVMRRRPDRIFQVLTKRPERALDWFTRYAPAFERFRDGVWPLPNVWLGVSIENARFTWRADVLRQIPAAVRFISAEPLLGSLYDVRLESNDRPVRDIPGRAGRDVRPEDEDAGVVPRLADDALCGHRLDRDRREVPDQPAATRTEARRVANRAPLDLSGIDWVIIGGESGPKARPFHLEHAREIVRACREDVIAPLTAELRPAPAVFVKQLGAKPVIWPAGFGAAPPPEPLKLHDRKGGDMDEWPADLRIREFPHTISPDGTSWPSGGGDET